MNRDYFNARGLLAQTLGNTLACLLQHDFVIIYDLPRAKIFAKTMLLVNYMLAGQLTTYGRVRPQKLDYQYVERLKFSPRLKFALFSQGFYVSFPVDKLTVAKSFISEMLVKSAVVYTVSYFNVRGNTVILCQNFDVALFLKNVCLLSVICMALLTPLICVFSLLQNKRL